MKRNNAFKLLFFGLMIMMLSSCATLKRWVSVPTYAPPDFGGQIIPDSVIV
ncbi:MAG: hypothetical protein ACI3Y4_03115 [Candidatus Cryptobacteroides sp.]